MESRPKEQELVGRTIAGKYAIESYLGGGAMGAVYKARQVALDKLVAIKVLHQEHTQDENFAARFQREARAASRLDHPNSIRVLDFGQDTDGLLYIAMELVEGRDLFRVLQQDAPLATPRIADILMQTLAALAIAHELGVVHRDLKPENIMVLRGADDEGHPRDVVKVCDFGIAKIPEPRSDEDARGAGRRLTTQGLVVGTPEYMSPEQAKGEALDARSDLYSMGIILYQLLTGRVPFDAETAIAIVLKHVTEELTPPSQANPDTDPRLEAICIKATQKKREDRYQTAREMRADLRAVLRGVDAPASMLPPPDLGVRADSVGLGPAVGSWGTGGLDSRAFGSAATLQVVDPKLAGTRARGIVVAEPSPSKVTPAGMEALEGERPRRSTVLVFAAAGAVALAAVMALLVANLRSRSGTMPPTAPASAAPVAAMPRGEGSGATAVHTPSSSPSLTEPFHAEAAHHATMSVAPSSLRGKAPTLARSAGSSATTPTTSPSAAIPYTPLAEASGGSVAPAVPPDAAAAPPSSPETDPAPPSAPAVAPSTPSSGSAGATHPPFDPAKARLDWRVRGFSGTTHRQAHGALAPFGGAWTTCYHDGLRAQGAPVVGSGLLHLETDETGRVTAAQVSGFGALPAVMRCIEQHAPATLPVDSTAAWVNVDLVFRPE